MNAVRESVDRRPLPTVSAWVAMLTVSGLPLVAWREFGTGEPTWWPLLAVGVPLGFLFATLVVDALAELRVYFAVLVGIVAFTEAVGVVRETRAWQELVAGGTWAVSTGGWLTLRLLVALAVLAGLLAVGRSRRDLFLVVGDLRATMHPTRLPGLGEPESWWTVGRNLGVVITLVTGLVLVLGNAVPLPGVDDLWVVPVVLTFAAMNAFTEEFLFRSALIPQLSGTLGTYHAVYLTAVLFGLGHFYGTPSGLLGVVLAGFLGWFLGKSMVETGGFTYAFLIHFAQDVLIFGTMALVA